MAGGLPAIWGPEAEWGRCIRWRETGRGYTMAVPYPNSNRRSLKGFKEIRVICVTSYIRISAHLCLSPTVSSKGLAWTGSQSILCIILMLAYYIFQRLHSHVSVESDNILAKLAGWTLSSLTDKWGNTIQENSLSKITQPNYVRVVIRT